MFGVTVICGKRSIRVQRWVPAFAGMTTLWCFAGMVSASAEPLENHYNDPFVQVTNGIQACPQPRGPFMTVKEAQAEAHPRIERGTTCFMSGRCAEPNSYRYDARIALAAQRAVAAAVLKSPSLAKSSVWLTVQRRFVFVHGCVAQRAQIARWQAVFRQAPEVEYVGLDLAIVRRGRLPVPMPYALMPEGEK